MAKALPPELPLATIRDMLRGFRSAKVIGGVAVCCADIPDSLATWMHLSLSVTPNCLHLSPVPRSLDSPLVCPTQSALPDNPECFL